MLFSLIRPALFALDAERAHDLTIRMLATGIPTALGRGPASLRTTVAGLPFANPLGLAAGVDKDGRAIDGLFGLGFGSVEIGTLTPLPQSGNPRPRLFRLIEDRAVINRMGFNNGGLAAALPRAIAAKRRGLLGINVGANKDATDRIADYAHGVAAAADVADYITVNISSPNTPGLRDLQHGSDLTDLLAACDDARRAPIVRPKLFLKVAPDLDSDAIDTVARAAQTHHVDALIVTNTTISRPSLRSAHGGETGGLVGCPARRARPPASRGFPHRYRRHDAARFRSAASTARTRPMPASAPGRAWCSSTPRWSITAPACRAASCAGWRKTSHAMALQPLRKPSAPVDVASATVTVPGHE